MPNPSYVAPSLATPALCQYSFSLSVRMQPLKCVSFISQWSLLLRVHDANSLPLQCQCSRHCRPQCCRWNGTFLWWSCSTPCWNVGVRHWQHLRCNWQVMFHHLFVDYDLRFSKTAFTSYGAFWLSFATLLIPSSGIADAYAASKDPAQEVDAIAIYLTAWMVVTFLFLLVPYPFCHAVVELTRLYLSSIALARSASRLA
jgi:hypothetical protein